MAESKVNLDEFILEPAVEVIVDASSRVKCSLRSRSKALLIYHQFKRCIGETQYDTHVLSAACISLSVKSNGEREIKVDAILLAFFNMLGSQDIDISYEDFKAVKKSLTMMEIIILRMIEFNLNHILAHEYLTFFLNDEKEMFSDLNVWNLVSEISVRIISDFYLSNKSLHYRAEELAASAILVALDHLSIDVDINPDIEIWIERLSKNSKKPEIFEDIFKICVISPIC